MKDLKTSIEPSYLRTFLFKLGIKSAQRKSKFYTFHGVDIIKPGAYTKITI